VLLNVQTVTLNMAFSTLKNLLLIKKGKCRCKAKSNV